MGQDARPDPKGSKGFLARYHKDIDAVVIQFVNTSGGNSWMVSEIVYDRIVEILHK